MVVDHGTAAQARVPNVAVAGKTGTAQWGAGNSNKSKSRTAWWFVGFAPVDKPQYAFAAVVEGDAGDNRHSGETAVPLIGKVLREIYKNNKPEQRHHKKQHDDDDEDDNNDAAPATTPAEPRRAMRAIEPTGFLDRINGINAINRITEDGDGVRSERAGHRMQP